MSNRFVKDVAQIFLFWCMVNFIWAVDTRLTRADGALSDERYRHIISATENLLIEPSAVTWFGDGRRFHVPAPSKENIDEIVAKFGELSIYDQAKYLAHLRWLFFAADQSGLRKYSASRDFPGERWAEDGAVELYWFSRLERVHSLSDRKATDLT
ncbi:MAG: hypothetical protein KC416_12835, partial [Myxococcales bacterium]|nr:hypothetical protein [Myxococcales bacterium]